MSPSKIFFLPTKAMHTEKFNHDTRKDRGKATVIDAIYGIQNYQEIDAANTTYLHRNLAYQAGLCKRDVIQD